MNEPLPGRQDNGLQLRRGFVIWGSSRVCNTLREDYGIALGSAGRARGKLSGDSILPLTEHQEAPVEAGRENGELG